MLALVFGLYPDRCTNWNDLHNLLSISEGETENVARSPLQFDQVTVLCLTLSPTRVR